MAVKVYKFRELDEIDMFCSGAVQGVDLSKWGQNIATGGGGKDFAPALAGLTLSFVAPGPVGTVTFVKGADSAGRLQFAELKSQIETAVAGLTVRQFEGKLTIVETTPTNGVTVAGDPSGGYATVTGTVDLSTLAYGAGGTLDTETIVFKHNGGTNLSVTFTAPGNEHDVVTQINAVTSPGIVASLNADKKLELTTDDAGAGVSLTINAGGTATAHLGLTAGTYNAPSTNTANQALGFDTLNNTVGKFYSTPFGASPTVPYVMMAYSVNDNMHVLYTWE